MMQFGRWLSLRSFLAALLALAVCVGGGCVILTSTTGDAEAVRALDAALQRVATAVSEKLGDGLATVERDVSLAAENAVFERGGRASAVQEFLGRWRSLHPDYADILFADRSGQVVATASGSFAGSDVSGTTWFARALTGLAIGDASERTRAGVEVPRNVIIGAPVRGGGAAAAGVLAIQLTPSWIEEAVSATRRVLGGAAQKASVQIVNAGGRSIHQSGAPAADSEAREANAVVGDEAALGWFVLAKGNRQPEAGSALLQGFALPLVLASALLAGLVGWLLGTRLGRSLASIRNAAAEDQVALLPRNASITDVADLADTVETCIGRSVGRERIQQETRAALTRSRDRVRAVKLLSGFTCWEIDLRNGQVTWAAGSADMADSTSERADDLDQVLARIDAEDRGLLRRAMQAACEEPGSVRETAVRTLAGREEARGRQLLLRMTAVAANGQPIRLHVLSREIGIVALPAPRASHVPEVVRSGEQAVPPLDARAHAVIAGLAHEIGEALTSVTRTAAALGNGAWDAQHPNGVQDIVRQAARGTALTRKLTAVLNRDTGDRPDATATQALSATLELISSAILPGSVIIQSPAQALPALTCTGRELEVMLLNLASDARESLPRGATATFAVETDPSAAGDGRIGLRVVLTAPTEFRADRGVAAIRDLMQDNGGTVAVESLPDRTLVTLSFLRAQAARAEPTDVRNAAGAAPILLIEPDPVMRAATAESLAGLGYPVLAAASAEEGRDALAGRRDFTAILCAHTTPTVNGVLLAEIASRTHPAVDIVLMAAEEVIARPPTAFRWLQKPFGSQDLARALERSSAVQRDAA